MFRTPCRSSASNQNQISSGDPNIPARAMQWSLSEATSSEVPYRLNTPTRLPCTYSAPSGVSEELTSRLERPCPDSLSGRSVISGAKRLCQEASRGTKDAGRLVGSIKQMNRFDSDAVAARGGVTAGQRRKAPSTASVSSSNRSTPGDEEGEDEEDEDMLSSDIDVRSRSGLALDMAEGGLQQDEKQILMSVVWQGGKLGIAYYDVDTTEMYMMRDTLDSEDFHLLRTVKSQIQPRTIVTSSKQDELVLRALKTPDNGIADNEDEATSFTDVEVQVLPSIDFSLEICKRRVLSLNLPGIRQDFGEEERTLYMSSLVPFDSVNMVRAVGGLLKFIEKWRVGVELEAADTRVPVLALKVFTLENMLQIDERTYRALQIFRRENHPSVYKSGSSAKEGLSMFGILNRCRSQAGSKLLRLWFLRPTRCLDTLRGRHETISYFMNPRNVEVVSSLQSCVKYIKDLSRILRRMTQAEASMGDWQALYKTVYNAIYIGDICRAQSLQLPIFKTIRQFVTEDLHKIANLISKIVDFDESAIQNRFVVKPSVDAELDEKKRTYNGLPDFMTKVARKELDRLGDDVTQCNVIYLPQVGYLLVIPVTQRMMQSNNFEIDGLEFMFLSNQAVHYKSASTRELDAMLGDTQCDITDYETSVMHKLQNSIVEHSQALLDVTQYLAELDCLLALATAARENDYVRPDMTADNVIAIKAGRHPLQELCCSPYVPNDFFSGEEHPLMKILTGPNASGKSVYLKQVALIVFMAHIGSFVPAEGALIGLMDGIFTRIQTLESVSVGLSTFMIDLNQVALAVRSASARSLVVLDEFGKGTEASDGAALLCACLRHWLSRGTSCSHTVVSTHFHDIGQHLPKTPLLKFQTMDVMHEGEELVFLYQLKEGVARCSYACHVASLAGVPPEVVKRAAEVTELLRQHQPIERRDATDAAAQTKRRENIVSGFLDLDLENDDPEDFLKDFVLPVSEGRYMP